MNSKKLIWVFWFSFFLTFAYGQEEENKVIIEQLVEDLAEELGEDYDYGQITDRLSYYHRYRIDINKTQGEELMELQFLSPFQIRNLLEYRKEAGKFLSLYELQAIEGFDFLTVERLLPFVQIVEGNRLLEALRSQDLLKEGKHDLMLRYGRNLEASEGYLRSEESGRSRYLGNRDRYLVRYRYQLPKRLQIAVNMKKDAGEQFFAGTQKQGFDFYSASLYFRELGKMENLVIGDYSLQFGQGLSLWSGLSFGKGSLLQNVARQGLGVQAYTSTNEVLFFRGIAGTVKVNKFAITPFVSYRKLDASFNEAENTFSSLGSSGYHRTLTEIKNRKSVEQLLYGANLQYSQSHFSLGASIYQANFNKELIPLPRLYNRFNFSGDQLTNASLHYSYTFPNAYFFGETAHSFQNGFAAVHGLISSISHELSLVLLHRMYQKNYYSFYNQGFSENSETKNERGFYSGLQWIPSRKVSWTVYSDFFRFPWLKFRVDAPSFGYDLFSLFSYTPIKTTEASMRYRFRRKQENSNLDSPAAVIEEVSKHQVRAELKYASLEKFKFRNRLEWVSYQKKDESREMGWMVYQDVIYQPLSSAFSGNLRLAIFKTDGYDSRIYAFENDVLYGYSFPAYANKGARFYGNLRYRVNRKTDVWFRYASFLYSEEGIGSGLDAIDGKMKSDIRVQLRIQI